MAFEPSSPSRRTRRSRTSSGWRTRSTTGAAHQRQGGRGFEEDYPQFRNTRSDYEEVACPPDEADNAFRPPCEVIEIENPPRDTIDVYWTPMRHGYEAALANPDPHEVDHDEQSLQEVLDKYGTITKFRVRHLSEGAATVRFETEQARLAASCANNTQAHRVPAGDEHLRGHTDNQTVDEEVGETVPGIEALQTKAEKIRPPHGAGPGHGARRAWPCGGAGCAPPAPRGPRSGRSRSSASARS